MSGETLRIIYESDEIRMFKHPDAGFVTGTFQGEIRVRLDPDAMDVFWARIEQETERLLKMMKTQNDICVSFSAVGTAMVFGRLAKSYMNGYTYLRWADGSDCYASDTFENLAITKRNVKKCVTDAVASFLGDRGKPLLPNLTKV